MASRLLKKIMPKYPRRKPALTTGENKAKPNENPGINTKDVLEKAPISTDLDVNLEFLKKILGINSDVIFRQFQVTIDFTRAAVIYVDGLADKNIINDNILKPLMLEYRMAGFNQNGGNLSDRVKNIGASASDAKEARTMEQLVAGILYGDVALIIDGQETALMFSIKGWPSRGISEPQSEVLVRGPREGFTEDLRTNTTMIRRKLRSPNLVFEDLSIGRVTSTAVLIAYIKGTADPQMVGEVKARLQKIDIDGVLESGYLEEFIEDNPYSPFPQILHTERPDRVAALLLEGRVAVVTDGTPFVLLAPAEFIAFMQSPEDYNERYIISTSIRWLRYIAFGISLLLPSLYIAITTFHQEMIPTRLLISLAAAREGVPFPALVEALAMEFTFEALREAGIRLPRAVGQAVSIVGALVIGQAAVQAGVVSPLMVIVVAITGISSFMNTSFSIALAMRLLRFPIMLLAGTLGLFGVMVGVLAILIHLAGLRSFGVPYLASLAPLHAGDLKDVAVRAPWWAMDKRPTETGKQNPTRQSPGQKPSAPEPGRNKR
ncbi:MAG: spore gernimation protein GerA [Peptococcaceae bacterium BRH_c4a]|nr:MAG: spore gernimation protein GerA [Peptococcaceae bacterium BRH_c4a]